MAIKFRKISTPEPVVDYLAEVLERELGSGKRVLWLVPGGSAISVVVAVGKLLKTKDIPLKNLVVSQTDERYGNTGHPDSNWKQLEDAGFALPGATIHTVLSDQDMSSTVDGFETFLMSEFEAADYKLGFFGIGPDGHTSGILPNSSAVHETRMVHGYDGGAYQRITTTAAALTKLDEAVVYAAGEAKWPVLDQLETDVPLDEQPAQILKQVPKTTIFNDYKGEIK